MKLYFATATCSHAVHIALREAGLPFDLVRFDLKTQALADGGDFAAINSKGFVPVLELDSGERLTEVQVILQYIADHTSGLPAPGNLARYRVLELLSFIGMEIHKIFWPIFHDGDDSEKRHARDKLARSFSWLETELGDRTYLCGETFSIADAYLVTVLNWTRAGGIDLGQWPALAAYRLRVRARPAVAAALAAEGLKR
jgi:glutathione S-transferase